MFSKLLSCFCHILILIFPLLAFADPTPNRAEIAKIYNIAEAEGQPFDVRYYRKNCPKDKWCPIVRKTGAELFPSDFFWTGNISRADLALQSANSYRGIVFWQAEGSRSQFVPKESTCHFKVEQGKFIYAHVDSNVDPGCREISSDEALIFPHTTLAIFRRFSGHETFIYVLSASPLGPAQVQSPISGKTVSIKTGQYAIARGDGTIEVNDFDVAHFLASEQTLTLGLGACPRDESYIKQQPAELQAILYAIQKSTSKYLKCDDNFRLPPNCTSKCLPGPAVSYNCDSNSPCYRPGPDICTIVCK